MHFETHHINFRKFKKQAKKAKESSNPKRTLLCTKNILMGIPLLIGIFLIFIIATSAIRLTNTLNFLPCLLCKELKTDAKNHTNFLLLGMGGENHSGGTLTDTIIVASLDHKKHQVSMISIPRDLYVKTEIVSGRINAILETGKEKGLPLEKSYQILKQKVEEISGLTIHYYALVDFEGFVKIIDTIGGIDIYVEEAIYDPYYPKGETIYTEVFAISEGWHNLDGETALKYARSRKTTSDFSRSLRQQQVLAAIKEKTLSIKILANPNKLKKIYEQGAEHFTTDLSWREILVLADIAPDFKKDDLYSQSLNDDPLIPGGFLYTPARENFGGAFVFLTYTHDYSETKLFTKLLYLYPEILKEKIKINVSNGTNFGGLAAMAYRHFIRYGFEIQYFGNALSKNIEKTTIYVEQSAKDSATVKALLTFLTADIFVGIPEEYLSESQDYEIVIELGEDYKKWTQENQSKFY